MRGFPGYEVRKIARLGGSGDLVRFFDADLEAIGNALREHWAGSFSDMRDPGCIFTDWIRRLFAHKVHF